MRRLVFPALLALASLTAASSALAAAPTAVTEEDKADLRRVSDYLNAVRSLSGRFIQVGPDGTSQEGTFYLKKPGRLRFEYDKPSPVLVVADGSTIAVSNSRLHTTDRYPLLNSPLRVLLSNDVDLSSDSRVSGISRESGSVSVTAREKSGPAEGQITLTFADSGSVLELRQWEVLDAQGMRTVIVVNDLKPGVELSPRLFTIEDLSPFHRSDD